jgi:predicted negative regulator of RcsB-dependent stress response
MKTLFNLIVLLLIVIVAVGFYQGWFHFSTSGADHTSSATISVDQDKIRSDEAKAKEKMEAFGQKVEKKADDRTDEIKQPERRP